MVVTTRAIILANFRGPGGKRKMTDSVRRTGGKIIYTKSVV